MKNHYLVIISLILLLQPDLFSQDTTTANVSNFQYLSPAPGAILVPPETNIIIVPGEALSPFDLNNTNILTVTGDISEIHNGRFYLTSDSKTLVFLPDSAFIQGEHVHVHLIDTLKTVTDHRVGSLDFNFRITYDKGCVKTSSNNSINWLPKAFNLASESAAPAAGDSTLIYPAGFPEVNVTKYSKPEDGNYFLSINQQTGNFLTILNNNGIPLFYKKQSTSMYDFKIQANGLLTYYLNARRQFYELDSMYTVVDSFYTGNGFFTDFHDLQVLPDGHAYLMALDTEPVSMDTVVESRNDTACVQGNIIQEIDRSKNVIWQWRTWDHFKITDSDTTVDLTQHTIPYTHLNSIDVVDDTTILLSTRYFDEITAINRKTGNIIWRFGGKNNQFNLSGNPPDFAWQHDARYIGNGNYSLFDNTVPYDGRNSKGLIYHLNPENHTGYLVREFRHNPEYFGFNMGNMQVTNKGNIVIGWGNIATGNEPHFMYAFTEFDSSGNLISDISLENSVNLVSYRAFKFPWHTSIISADKDSLLFDKTSPNSKSSGIIKLTNNSSFPLTVDGIFYKDSVFQPTDTFPIKLLPASNIDLNFDFLPADSSEIRDTAYIVTTRNDEMYSLPVILIGNSTITDLKEKNNNIPIEFNLAQNFPNPFNPSTIIGYSIAKSRFVTLKIYDILGRLVKTIVNETKPAGTYSVNLNLSNFSNGVYFYKLSAGNFSEVKKMVLLK